MVNVFRNMVNQLRGSRQLCPSARVNLFSMGRHTGSVSKISNLRSQLL